MADGGENFKIYWSTGAGGRKIRWNTPGDFKRCVDHVEKYALKEGFSAEGFCARLHKRMTGVWPGDKANVGRKN